MDLMIDLETLDTVSTAVVPQCGLLLFNWDQKRPIDLEQDPHMLVGLDIQDQLDLGRTISKSTLLWWSSQPTAARTRVFGGEMTLKRAVQHIADTVENWQEHYGRIERLWAKGPDFDKVMLHSCFDLVGIKWPWAGKEDYRMPRDVRTYLAALEGLHEFERKHGHEALIDCEYQANDIITARTMLTEVMRTATRRRTATKAARKRTKKTE